MSRPSEARGARAGLRSYQGRVSLGLATAAAVAAAVYIRAARGISVPELVDPVGPRAFPYLVGGALLVCAMVLLAEGLWWPAGDGERAEPFSWRDPRYLIAGGVMAWTLLYFLLFDILGYVVATALFLAVLIHAFGGRRPGVGLAVGIGFAVASFIAFDRYLDVFLPPGVLAWGTLP